MKKREFNDAAYKKAYERAGLVFVPLLSVYQSYENQASTCDEKDSVEVLRAQSHQLEYMMHPDEGIMRGIVRKVMETYLEAAEENYVPILESEEMHAIVRLTEHEDAAERVRGYVLVNLLMRAAHYAGASVSSRPGAATIIRLGLAENLRLASYFNEVEQGSQMADAAARFYPKDLGRIADLPFSQTIETSLREVLDHATRNMPHVEKQPAPEGYEWKRSEKKPKLRLLLKIDPQ